MVHSIAMVRADVPIGEQRLVAVAYWPVAYRPVAYQLHLKARPPTVQLLIVDYSHLERNRICGGT